MVSWASGVSMIGGNPGAWSGRLCAHGRSRPSHPVDPRTGAVGGPQFGLLSVSWTMISPWSGRRYANGFMVPRRLWSLSPVGTVGRHGRSVAGRPPVDPWSWYLGSLGRPCAHGSIVPPCQPIFCFTGIVIRKTVLS